MSSIGDTLAYSSLFAATSVASLLVNAPFQPDYSGWKLILSPPDPNAGTWYGTFLNGAVVWPTPLDPSPPAGGLAVYPDTEFTDGQLV